MQKRLPSRRAEIAGGRANHAHDAPRRIEGLFGRFEYRFLVRPVHHRHGAPLAERGVERDMFQDSGQLFVAPLHSLVLAQEHVHVLGALCGPGIWYRRARVRKKQLTALTSMIIWHAAGAAYWAHLGRAASQPCCSQASYSLCEHVPKYNRLVDRCFTNRPLPKMRCARVWRRARPLSRAHVGRHALVALHLDPVVTRRHRPALRQERSSLRRSRRDAPQLQQ